VFVLTLDQPFGWGANPHSVWIYMEFHLIVLE
jgi:hypothetical protein